MGGIRIQHRWKRSQIDLFVMLDTPIQRLTSDKRPQECSICHVVHPFKTIHIWLDDSGSAIISRGVFDAMSTRWTGPPEYDVVGEVGKPPPLKIGKGAKPREAQDQEARKVTIHKLKKEARWQRAKR
jgi:hypothetical protein